MIHLILSICASTVILILFRLFKTFEVDTKQAIVINYMSAFLFGLWSYESSINTIEIINSSWLYGAIILGLLFITIFNLMAITAQNNGLSVVSVASKMSLIIPIIAGIFLYQEVLNPLQITGIVLALVSVYLVSVKKDRLKGLSKSLILPLLVFLGSGIIDSSLKYFEYFYLSKENIPLFSACIFLFAAIFGSIWMIGIQKYRPSAFTLKSISAGLILGIVNYYSIYFLIKALKIEWLNSATVFTINNVSIVTLSSLIGFIAFKESISKSNFLGIMLAIIAIVLISYNL